MEGKVNNRKWSDNDRQYNVEKEYNELVSELLIGQKLFIPNRNIRSNRNYPKWMTDSLKHFIEMKRRIYKRFNSGKTDLKEG